MGYVEVMTSLLEHGAEVDTLVGGGSALWLALHHLDEDNEAVQLLRKHGGTVVEPDDSYTLDDEGEL